MMKKLIFTTMLAVMGVCNASAQFEKGKVYIAATANCAEISYSKATKFNFGLAANAGYMFEDNFLAIADLGFNYNTSDLQTFTFGAKCRYFIIANGLFLQLGAKYVHRARSFNDAVVSPEVGYCFFFNGHLTFEPSVCYDISLTHFKDYSKIGLKMAIGWYF